MIIEPFAGGASYSLAHHEHQVWLNDIDGAVAAIWNFIIHSLGSGSAEIPSEFMQNVKQGDKVSKMPGAESWPLGLLRLIQSEANVGTQGATGIHDQVTKFAVPTIKRLPAKMAYWAPRVAHWRITQCDYRDLPNLEATWFMDPPYNNAAGQRYRHHGIDYAELAEWCRSRRGQVIVCEQVGATWLPFEDLAPRQGVRSRYQKSETREVVWHRPRLEVEMLASLLEEYLDMVIRDEARASVALDHDPDAHTCHEECREFPGCPGHRTEA